MILEFVHNLTSWDLDMGVGKFCYIHIYCLNFLKFGILYQLKNLHLFKILCISNTDTKSKR